MNFLKPTDPAIYELVKAEKNRQAETLMLIPSENYASQAVEAVVGSCLANKYAEGYPHKRYYQGQKFVDIVEELTQKRAKKIFKVAHVNVQPYSGSPANAAVYFGLLKPGDTIMGLTLSHGGHLTHGHPKVTFSGKIFNSIQYEVGKDEKIDYDALLDFVKNHQPKLIIAGTTAYPRILEFAKFAKIADSVGAYLMADISHIAGLVVAGVHPSPAAHAHVITTTTHKTLRGPRGAMIMITNKGLKKDQEMIKKIDRAVFPGLQGGPHINTIAGIAVALKEASTSKFKTYAKNIVANAQVLAGTLKKEGIRLTTNGTDNHLMVADLRPIDILGKDAAVLLEKANIVVNYNTVPYDPNPPFNPSGIRLGTPAVTSRGMGKKEMRLIGTLIAQVLKKKVAVSEAKKQVKALCRQFPIPTEY
ncbi:serine hydroxymethyltransferase [Candidatus Beckwithbacteria bacterium RBG_13_42_9]|uniref:Serine hydroxymethyltransferase n=1 Tax=Candidatus Beckwithbacteria bacterium RBG_13_42_9 TaxID=1797457 RepID=A0A1F5E6H5_9BACT|nr:MAG: serine hydroxymethyltransferase [Candidatus Beckwithbacteria bacterium RBG_13_42_9]